MKLRSSLAALAITISGSTLAEAEESQKLQAIIDLDLSHAQAVYLPARCETLFSVLLNSHSAPILLNKEEIRRFGLAKDWFEERREAYGRFIENDDFRFQLSRFGDQLESSYENSLATDFLNYGNSLYPDSVVKRDVDYCGAILTEAGVVF